MAGDSIFLVKTERVSTFLLVAKVQEIEISM
jgi:hypothetical protein